MIMQEKTARICRMGHRYYKNSDCPICPICEQERKSGTGFLSTISAPARRALENQGITSLQLLANYSEKEILQLHGMGPGTIPRLREALAAEGLQFQV